MQASSNLQKRARKGGVGGSAQLKLIRKTKTTDRKLNAMERVLKKVGCSNKMAEMKQTYQDLTDNRKPHGCVYDTADGYVISLIELGYSERELRAWLGIGGHMFARLKREIADPTLRERKLEPKTLAHAVTEQEIQDIKDNVKSWDCRLEDGFPCSHRKQQRFFIQPAEEKEKITWTSLHGEYEVAMEAKNSRKLSFSRWRQYVNFFFSEIKLARTKEDVCDGCFSIDIELRNPKITEQRKAELIELKATHLQDAIIQRRCMQAFVKMYVKRVAPDQVLPDVFIHDLIDEGGKNLNHDVAAPLPPGCVQVQAEDFGGDQSMPHFGCSRPAVDYFQSNLNLRNFVVSDICTAINHIYYYDERAQDKGADALCSLRLLHHLSKLCTTLPPKISVSILDNCVGQNKSQIVMKFFAFLSVCFYKEVVALYLKSGHSHMLPDRATAHQRNAISGVNLYHPDDLVEVVNRIRHISATFLDHNSNKRPFFTGWGQLLDKYFHSLPGGYTENYFFEINFGVATVRNLADIPGNFAWSFNMNGGDPALTQKKINS